MGPHQCHTRPVLSHYTQAAPLRNRAVHDNMLNVRGLRCPHLVHAYPRRAPIAALRRQAHRFGTNSYLVRLSAEGSVLINFN